MASSHTPYFSRTSAIARTMSRVIVAIIAVASTTLSVGHVVHAKTTGTLRVAEQPFTITSGRATFVFQTSALANLPFDAQLKVQLHNPVASRESLQLVADESVAIRTIDEITFDYFLLPRDSLNRLVVVDVLFAVCSSLAVPATRMRSPQIRLATMSFRVLIPRVSVCARN